jgi:hypothetical protein
MASSTGIGYAFSGLPRRAGRDVLQLRRACAGAVSTPGSACSASRSSRITVAMNRWTWLPYTGMRPCVVGRYDISPDPENYPGHLRCPFTGVRDLVSGQRGEWR